MWCSSTAHDIGDECFIRVLADDVTNADGGGIVASGAGIDKGQIFQTGLPRQF
jgi:hypothetical protein